MNHYTVYKITNLVNGRYYIGKHQTKDLDDGYMGSGKLIRAAIKKYGIECFKKEILSIFETEDEMNAKEAELVTEELIASGSVYNLCAGGQGGFGHLNSSGKSNMGWKNNPVKGNSERARKAGIVGAKAFVKRMKEDVEFALNFSKMRREKTLGVKGRKHSQETKEKIGKKNSISSKGNKNSQFNTMWITNGTENRKIKKDLDSIPEGWYKGRR